MKNKIVVRACISFFIALVSACGGSSSPSIPTYSLSGSVSNLTSSGLVLFNGVESVKVPANATSITFSSQFPTGTGYSVSIASQPLGFTDVCVLSNEFGTVGSANVTNIVVSCHVAEAIVSTLAGNGHLGRANGVGTAASFNYPFGIAVDSLGNLYVTDRNNNSIRKITSTGLVTTFAGPAPEDGYPANFNNPNGIAVDALNNIYVADTDNNLIRKITPTGVLTTIAGSGSQGNANGNGTAASFNYPYNVAVDTLGNVYVADAFNNLIRKITATGIVTTFAGNGSIGNLNATGILASFYSPHNVAIDTLGNIYVADSFNNLIRKITMDGVVTTLAGNGSIGSADGKGSAASFYFPFGIAVDMVGNVYVSDRANHSIRKITAAGLVTTLAGSGIEGKANGVGTAASFDYPEGIAVDKQGNVYVADSVNSLIRKINPH